MSFCLCLTLRLSSAPSISFVTAVTKACRRTRPTQGPGAWLQRASLGQGQGSPYLPHSGNLMERVCFKQQVAVIRYDLLPLPLLLAKHIDSLMLHNVYTSATCGVWLIESGWVWGRITAFHHCLRELISKPPRSGVQSRKRERERGRE